MSTEQWSIFLRQANSQQICKQTQKGALNLAEIQRQSRHNDHMNRGFPQLYRDQPHATFTLCHTKPALYITRNLVRCQILYAFK